MSNINFSLILAVPMDKSGMTATASYSKALELARVCICFRDKCKKDATYSNTT